jgi:hypothetical protein
MRFFVWLFQIIKGIFTSEVLETVEKATIEATTFTLIELKPSPQGAQQKEVDPMECLENFTEITLTV